jgi:uroporphyrinogen-III synthase
LLRQRDIDPVIEPMLLIRPVAAEALDIAGVQGILLTSANGVRMLVRHISGENDPLLHLPVFSVGKATASAARDAGFDNIESADGDVAELAGLVAARLDPKAGTLVHVAGSRVAGDLSGLLTDKGFAVHRAVLYEAGKPEALTPALADSLKSHDIGLVLFFSAATAQNFVDLVAAAGLASALAPVTALCLSQAVATALERPGGAGWADVRVAPRPDMDGMMELVDDVRAHKPAPAMKGR